MVGKGNTMIVICGPCVIEDEDTMMYAAEAIVNIISKFDNIDFYFKSSCIKDNRTNLQNEYGPGMIKGLKILNNIKTKFGIRITTDFHNAYQVEEYGDDVDLIQIPAYLGMQTSLITSAVKATSNPIHVKKPQFLNPERINQIVGKIFDLDPKRRIFITDRGMCFGFDFLVLDPRTTRLMRKRIDTEYRLNTKILIDITHPNKYWNDYTYCYDLAKMAIAVGSDGLFIECHPNPISAACDSDNQLPIKELESLLNVAKAIENAQHK